MRELGCGASIGETAQSWEQAEGDDLMRTRTLTLGMVLSLCALIGALVASDSALALTEGRVYEMVSPPYKAGYGVGGSIVAVAPSGEGVVFSSLGVFAGADVPGLEFEYLSHRTVSGWVTTSVEPPADFRARSNVEDFSSSLESVLGRASLGANVGQSTEFTSLQNQFLMHDVDLPDIGENWSVFGGITLEQTNHKPFFVSEVGASGDLCHVVTEGDEGALLPEAEGSADQIYDVSSGCKGEPSLTLVGLNNDGKLINANCTSLGAGAFGANSRFGAISGDGEEIFFTAKVAPTEPTCGGERHAQLFVRLGGSRTIEVSRPLDTSKPFGGCGDEGGAGEAPGEVPCGGALAREPAEFVGASRDGSRVFFTTKASLAGTDTDSGRDLYMASIGCPGGGECEASEKGVTSLVQVSQSLVGGEAADVQNVVRVAPDGSRVYFVARGVLGDEPNGEGDMPEKGADNFYVYNTITGSVRFIAHCTVGASDSTGDGRFLVFSTYAQLIRRGAQADGDGAQDVYRYDAETGVLDRVSLGEAGDDANGNGPYDASIANVNVTSARVYNEYELDVRAISEDGSRIVFSSAEPLSRDATNGLTNIYEWHQGPGGEGVVSLISSGSSETPDTSPVISPSGRDIFFITNQGLTPGDTDGQTDVYDARLDGGFPPVAAPVAPCAGDACQGPLTNPAPLLVPGSVSQAPGGNFPAPAPPPAAVTVKPRVKVTPGCRKGYVKKKGKCVKSRSGKRATKSAKGRK
jgi:hypothetical protein